MLTKLTAIAALLLAMTYSDITPILAQSVETNSSPTIESTDENGVLGTSSATTVPSNLDNTATAAGTAAQTNTPGTGGTTEGTTTTTQTTQTQPAPADNSGWWLWLLPLVGIPLIIWAMQRPRISSTTHRKQVYQH